MPLVDPAVIAEVREYAESNMDGLVTILRGGVGVLDKTTGKMGGLSNAVQIYGDPVPDGTIGTIGAKARVHLMTGQGSLSLGPGEINLRQTTVSIPWDVPQVPQRDDIVLIRDAGQDDTLTGASLRIVEVAGGGLFGDARRLSCTTWGYSSQWDGNG